MPSVSGGFFHGWSLDINPHKNYDQHKITSMKLTGTHGAMQLTRAIPFILFLKLIKEDELDALGQIISKQSKDRQLGSQRYYSDSEEENTIICRTAFEWLQPGSPTSLRFMTWLIQKETSVDIEVRYCGTRSDEGDHDKQPVEDESCIFLFTTHAGRPAFVKDDISLDRFDLSMKIVTPHSTPLDGGKKSGNAHRAACHATAYCVQEPS